VRSAGTAKNARVDSRLAYGTRDSPLFGLRPRYLAVATITLSGFSDSLGLPAPVLGQRTASIVGLLDATLGIAANERLSPRGAMSSRFLDLVFMVASSGFSLTSNPSGILQVPGKPRRDLAQAASAPNISCLGRLLDVMQSVGAVGEGAVEIEDVPAHGFSLRLGWGRRTQRERSEKHFGTCSGLA
jgi:hypothetical protein